MHQKLATSLYRAEDDLRRGGFRHPLLVVNTDGGVTRVAKTRALSTYQSGPARGGVHAGALLCRELGIEDAITADVGGTSTDCRTDRRRRAGATRPSVEVGGVRCCSASVELLSFAIGGGSIARVEEAGSSRTGERGGRARSGMLRAGRARADAHRCLARPRLPRPRLLPRRPEARRAWTSRGTRAQRASAGAARPRRSSRRRWPSE